VYDHLVVTPEGVEAVGDEDVLMIARLTARASGSGVELDTRQGYIWTVRDGVACGSAGTAARERRSRPPACRASA
jgi:hypothetical protein